MIKQLIAITCIVILSGCAQEIQPPNRTISPFPLPELNYPDLDGTPRSTTDYRGYILVLNFFATWSPQSAREVKSLMDLQSKYHEQGLRVVSVSMDTNMDALKDFMNRFKINHPVLLGTKEIPGMIEKIDAIPTTFIVDRRGNVLNRYTRAIPESIVVQEIDYILQEEEKAKKAAGQ